jgi:hypothetical protein
VPERAMRFHRDAVADRSDADGVIAEVWMHATPVAPTMRSRCSGWKFDTPAVRRRPPLTRSIIALQVEM